MVALAALGGTGGCAKVAPSYQLRSLGHKGQPAVSGERIANGLVSVEVVRIVTVPLLVEEAMHQGGIVCINKCCI